MKLKNILVPFTCYFILAAFVGCVACGVLSHSGIQQQKALHFSDKKAYDINPDFLFEEDEDFHETSVFDLLYSSDYLNHTIAGHDFKTLCTPFSNSKNQNRKLKIPLFIHFRVLKI